MATKKTNQRIHARRRLKERFDKKLTAKKRAEIISQIQTKKSTFVERQSWRVSVHMVKVDTQVIKCVYDRKRKELVTFLYSK